MTSLRIKIRTLATSRDKTIKQVHEELSGRLGLKTTYQNFNQRLTKGTLRYDELLVIADILDYEIQWVDKSAKK